MELMRYVDNLRQELTTAAEAGDPQTREVAERLVAPLSSAIRLVLLDALSTAADEITRELAPGSVEVRLRGLDPGFVVTRPPSETAALDVEDGFAPASGGAALPAPPEPPAAPPADLGAKDGVTSRINFRPPEQLKTRIEEAAAREGLSVNAWLVRAVSATLTSQQPSQSSPSPHHAGPSAPQGGRSYTGWVH
ncbi:hypothetical protein [Streptomyces sp. DSM 118878]